MLGLLLETHSAPRQTVPCCSSCHLRLTYGLVGGFGIYDADPPRLSSHIQTSPKRLTKLTKALLSLLSRQLQRLKLYVAGIHKLPALEV